MERYLPKYLRLLIMFPLIFACSDLGDPLILYPEAHLENSSIDFDLVTLGSSQMQQITLINRGPGDLTGEITLQQSGTVFSIDPAGPFSVIAENTLVLEVTFEPLDEVDYSGEIIISTNQPGMEELAVDLSGSGTALPVPALSLSTSTLDFGTLLLGASSQQQFTISSVGTDTLLIDSVATSMEGVTSNATVPLLLAPSESSVVTVTFSALSSGAFSGELRVYSNTSAAVHTLTLAAQVETPISYAADVQPVFDNSCSGCHGNNGGLTLSSYDNLMAGDSNNGPVVTTGNGASSLLIRKLRGTAGTQMPAGGPFLSENTISTIETWIDQGTQNN